MPRYARTHLSPEVRKAVLVLGGSEARIAVLSAVIESPGSTAGQIAALAGLSVNTVKEHLSKLVRDGLIDADPSVSIPHSERRGQHPTYMANSDALRKAWMQVGSRLGLTIDEAEDSPDEDPKSS